MRLGAVRIDLDRGLESLESRGRVIPLGLNLSQADQGLDIFRVMLERSTEAILRLVELALQQQDGTKPLPRFGRPRRLSDQLTELPRSPGGSRVDRWLPGLAR